MTWCINPYDEFLNKEYFKMIGRGKHNRTKPDRDFDWVISTIKNYGIVGIGHPARYTGFLKDKKYEHINTMFDRYKMLGQSKYPLFTEGYYQSYPQYKEDKALGQEYNRYLDFINTQAHQKGIYRTGSTDAHSKSIFTN